MTQEQNPLLDLAYLALVSTYYPNGCNNVNSNTSTTTTNSSAISSDTNSSTISSGNTITITDSNGNIKMINNNNSYPNQTLLDGGVIYCNGGIARPYKVLRIHFLRRATFVYVYIDAEYATFLSKIEWYIDYKSSTNNKEKVLFVSRYGNKGSVIHLSHNGMKFRITARQSLQSVVWMVDNQISRCKNSALGFIDGNSLNCMIHNIYQPKALFSPFVPPNYNIPTSNSYKLYDWHCKKLVKQIEGDNKQEEQKEYKKRQEEYKKQQEEYERQQEEKEREKLERVRQYQEQLQQIKQHQQMEAEQDLQNVQRGCISRQSIHNLMNPGPRMAKMQAKCAIKMEIGEKERELEKRDGVIDLTLNCGKGVEEESETESMSETEDE